MCDAHAGKSPENVAAMKRADEKARFGEGFVKRDDRMRVAGSYEVEGSSSTSRR
jgi:hypothetical protein